MSMLPNRIALENKIRLRSTYLSYWSSVFDILNERIITIIRSRHRTHFYSIFYPSKKQLGYKCNKDDEILWNRSHIMQPAAEFNYSDNQPAINYHPTIIS